LTEQQCGCGSNNHQRHQSLQKLEEELKETESKYRQLIGFKVKMKNKEAAATNTDENLYKLLIKLALTQTL
jgi:hypothetical protein